jgi:hypothetical protein
MLTRKAESVAPLMMWRMTSCTCPCQLIEVINRELPSLAAEAMEMHGPDWKDLSPDTKEIQLYRTG